MSVQLSPEQLHVRVETEAGFCDVCGSFDCAGEVLHNDTKAVLEVHICDQRRSYLAQFPSEQSAIEFYRRKETTHNHVISEVEEASVPRDWKRLLDILYPICEHGLSESLCWGPMHYPTADQERERWGD